MGPRATLGTWKVIPKRFTRGTVAIVSRELLLDWCGESASFRPARIERADLYGARRRMAVDASGAACTRAAMTLDGQNVLRPGMTAQGWFTDDDQNVEASEIVEVGVDGSPLPLTPSTLGVAQSLIGPVDPRDILDITVESVLALSPLSLPESLKAELDAGRAFRFAYCYRAEPEPPTAFILANAEGIFAIIGRRTETAWMTKEQAATDHSGTDDDDLDFEMV